MNFDKQISYLFHLNRDNFNIADRKIEKVLHDVFERGKIAGKKDMKKSVAIAMKNLI